MRNRRWAIRVGSLTALGALSTGAVWAQALPDAVTAAHCDSVIGGQGSNLDDPSGCVVPGVTASLGLAPTASASDHVAYAGGINDHAFTHSEIVYYFEVTGGTEGTSVPLLIDTRLSSSASSPGPAGQTASYAEAAVQVAIRLDGGSVFPLASATVCTDLSSCTARAYAGTLAVQTYAGALNFVTLAIEAGVGDSFSAADASADAASWIYIDPSFAAASAYTLVFSAGVGNASPVPEPGPLTLLALGLGGLMLRLGGRRGRHPPVRPCVPLWAPPFGNYGWRGR